MEITILDIPLKVEKNEDMFTDYIYHYRGVIVYKSIELITNTEEYKQEFRSLGKDYLSQSVKIVDMIYNGTLCKYLLGKTFRSAYIILDYILYYNNYFIEDYNIVSSETFYINVDRRSFVAHIYICDMIVIIDDRNQTAEFELGDKKIKYHKKYDDSEDKHDEMLSSYLLRTSIKSAKSNTLSD